MELQKKDIIKPFTINWKHYHKVKAAKKLGVSFKETTVKDAAKKAFYLERKYILKTTINGKEYTNKFFFKCMAKLYAGIVLKPFNHPYKIELCK